MGVQIGILASWHLISIDALLSQVAAQSGGPGMMSGGQMSGGTTGSEQPKANPAQ